MGTVDKIEISDCIFCGKKPRIIHYDTNMYYAVCTCDKHNKYEFLGCDEQVAIDRWNFANRPMNRSPSPRPKKKKE